MTGVGSQLMGPISLAHGAWGVSVEFWWLGASLRYWGKNGSGGTAMGNSGGGLGSGNGSTGSVGSGPCSELKPMKAAPAVTCCQALLYKKSKAV